MNFNAEEAIKKYHMLEQGESVLVGLSGGADSVALLDFLCARRSERGWKVYACHINHCLRGEEADRDQRFVEALCEKYGVELFVFREDIPAWAARLRTSAETAARERRYARFDALSRRLAAKTATAHTLSDCMETVLFNLARGCGVGGLGGIPPVRGRIIRPLIETTRAQVEAYCAARGLSYVTDSTNLSDDYTRNYIRHHLAPGLYHINPAAHAAVGALCETARQTQDYMEQMASTLLEESGLEEGAEKAYDAARLGAAHPALRRQALARLLEEEGVEVSRARVLRMEQALAPGQEKVVYEMKSGVYLNVDCGRLFFTARKERAEDSAGGAGCFPVRIGDLIQINTKKVEFLCLDGQHFKCFENNEKIPLKNMVDYDKISENAWLRTRQSGDSFAMPGRKWTKSLKKLFNEYAIPPGERGALLVGADEQGVFWVERFGAHARAAVDSGTTRILAIKMTEEAK